MTICQASLESVFQCTLDAGLRGCRALNCTQDSAIMRDSDHTHLLTSIQMKLLRQCKPSVAGKLTLNTGIGGLSWPINLLLKHKKWPT